VSAINLLYLHVRKNGLWLCWGATIEGINLTDWINILKVLFAKIVLFFMVINPVAKCLKKPNIT